MESGITGLIESLQQLQSARYFDVAILTVFVLDYLLTLTTEINSLWPAPWTIAKISYLISRYSPFLDGPITLALISSAPSIDDCPRLMKVVLWSGGIGANCSQFLLLYRAYALVGRTRLSAILLSLLAVIMVVVNFLFTALIHKSTDFGGNVPSIFPTCSVGEGSLITNKFLIVVPIWTIAFETILFGVIYWAKVKKYREDDNWLIRKIYRDALLYYLLLVVISVGSLIIWFSVKGPVRELGPTLPRFFSSIISSRIILNIRQYGNGTPDGTRAWTTQPEVSRLRIAAFGRGSRTDL